MNIFRAALFAALLAIPQLYGTPISLTFSVVPIGTSGSDTLYRYTYVATGSVAANQEIDIEFDPAHFGKLLNPTGPTGFDILLFQPNNPPGTTGDFSALALTNIGGPSTFTVDTTALGSFVPGAQPFQVNAIGADGTLTLLQSGVTVSASSVPEPNLFLLTGGTLLSCCGWLRLRRRRWRL